jgi:hypothetical protein
MATTSAQPGSNVPKAPMVIDRNFPAIPENLGNLFLSATGGYESPATAWYVRWNACGAYVGTRDGRKRSALRGMAIIEKLLVTKGEGVTTAQLHGYQPTYIEGKSIGNAVYQEFGSDGVHDGEAETNNHYPWNSHSTGPGFHIADLVPRKADETRDLQRSLALALELIRAKIPSLADHLSEKLSVPLESDRTWRYADHVTQWTFGCVWQYDGSNVVVWNHDGSGKTWKIRFGEHYCIVGESDGMWLLSALLRHPGTELNVEQIWKEAGVPARRAQPDLNDTKLFGRQVSDLRELAMEFAEDLKIVCERTHYYPEGAAEYTDISLPKSVSELIEDLRLVVPKLEESVVGSLADRTLKAKGSQGIVRASRYDGSYARGEDYPKLKARLNRCNRLIADLQELRRENESPANVTKEDMASDAFRKRGLVLRSVTAAIDEISNKNAFLGAYFRKGFRTTNLCFALDVGSKWNVVCGKGLTEFSTDAA